MAEYQAEGIQGDYLIYRDKPMVRDHNVIVYGDMKDPYYLYLMIISEKEETFGKNTVKIPDQIIVQVVSSDANIPSRDRMVKQFEKNGLYDALDIGIVWLDKLNKK